MAIFSELLLKVLLGGFLGYGAIPIKCFMCDAEENDSRAKKLPPIEPFAYSEEELSLENSFKPLLDGSYGPFFTAEDAINIKTVEFPDGVYSGFLVNGLRQGRGVITFSSGEFQSHRYEGVWRADVICGPGKLIYPNGDVYIGCFDEGRPYGVGTYRAYNGQVFRGLHSQDGFLRGELSLTNGDRYSGEFVQGQMQGLGIYYHNNGNIYEG